MNKVKPETVTADDSSRAWLKAYPKGIDWHQHFEPQPLFRIIDDARARFGARPAGDVPAGILEGRIEDHDHGEIAGVVGWVRGELDRWRYPGRDRQGSGKILRLDPGYGIAMDPQRQLAVADIRSDEVG